MRINLLGTLHFAEIVKFHPAFSLGLGDGSRLGSEGQRVQRVEHPGGPQVVPLLVGGAQGNEAERLEQGQIGLEEPWLRF